MWYGGFLPAGRARTGRMYDGWFPSQPKPEEYAAQLHEDANAANARKAQELVDDTRARLILNVSEELACEALAYRLEETLSSSSSSA